MGRQPLAVRKAGPRIHPASHPPLPLLLLVQAKELLGWEPVVSLRQGLSLMVSDFKTRLHVSDTK